MGELGAFIKIHRVGFSTCFITASASCSPMGVDRAAEPAD
jgi:hypothetical protein